MQTCAKFVYLCSSKHLFWPRPQTLPCLHYVLAVVLVHYFPKGPPRGKRGERDGELIVQFWLIMQLVPQKLAAHKNMYKHDKAFN